MKKTAIIILLAAVFGAVPVFAATKTVKKPVQTTPPTKYEIGNFDFNLNEEGKKEEVTLSPVNQTVTKEETQATKENAKKEEVTLAPAKKTVEEGTPEKQIKDTTPAKKQEVIELKKETQNKTEIKNIQSQNMNTEQASNSVVQKDSKKKKGTKKVDKDEPPVKFMIVPVQYSGQSKTSIEKL